MTIKKIFSVFLCFFSLTLFSQNIFKYEKEVDSLKNYKHEEIEFFNTEEKIKLSGTLISPKKDFEKIVIIIPGSGKDTRNSHYILAENLLENGIGVFRFDERGIGKSEGKYSELSNDLSNDLVFAFNSLKKKATKKIGLLGHSIGGVAILETIKSDINPDFIVLIEAPIVKNGDFILNQIEMDFENNIPQIMRDHKSKNEIINFLKDYFSLISKDNPKLTKSELAKFIKSRNFNKKFILLLNDSFLIEMLNKNIEEVLKTINIPTLYQTGTKDKIINHKREIDLIRSFNNKYIQIDIFQDLNHYLTEKNAPIGTSLYKMDKSAMNNIIKWILNV
ncbi:MULTISPECIES: lysophospholipase [Flavobacterium]|uniref:Serine aminopeptidase S33 domain-containing protein n=1 Tax=Flavobacterium hankyongi TaxID=1176532 RepID=A0ABP8ZQE3_9FLAO|nr:lysophospholipase [Flavobacterium sp. N1846]